MSGCVAVAASVQQHKHNMECGGEMKRSCSEAQGGAAKRCREAFPFWPLGDARTALSITDRQLDSGCSSMDSQLQPFAAWLLRSYAVNPHVSVFPSCVRVAVELASCCCPNATRVQLLEAITRRNKRHPACTFASRSRFIRYALETARAVIKNGGDVGFLYSAASYMMCKLLNVQPMLTN